MLSQYSIGLNLDGTSNLIMDVFSISSVCREFHHCDDIGSRAYTRDCHEDQQLVRRSWFLALGLDERWRKRGYSARRL